MAALIRRCRDLEIINENQYTYLMIQIQQRGYRLRSQLNLISHVNNRLCCGRLYGLILGI